MTPELKSLLERQAAWQRARADRPWLEKLRAAVVLREAARLLRRPGQQPAEDGSRRSGAGSGPTPDG